jgi:hypothetical protein
VPGTELIEGENCRLSEGIVITVSMVVDILRGMAPEFLPWALVIVIGLLFFVITYFAIKIFAARRGVSLNVGWRSGGAEQGLQSPAAPTAAAARNVSPKQQALLRRLDATEQVVARIYQGLLWFVIIGGTAFGAYLYRHIPDDGTRQLVLFYCGIIYLIGMLWASAQLRSIHRRLHRRPDPDDVFEALRSKVNVQVEPSPQVRFVDNEALNRAENHLEQGGTLDEACALMDPEYGSMSGMMQKLFRTAVKAALEQRRNKPQ